LRGGFEARSFMRAVVRMASGGLRVCRATARQNL